MQAIAFYSVYSITWLIGLFPLRVLYVFSDVLFFLFYHVLKYRVKVVDQNLRKSFPGKQDKEIKQIKKKFYRHFSDVIVESIKMFHWDLEQLSRRVKYKNPELLDEIYNKNKHAIAVVAHYGNWEWLLGLSAYTRHQGLTIFKPVNNKYFNKVLKKNRERFGTRIVKMKRIYRVIHQHVRDNKLCITAFISDQSPVADEVQYFTEFLNQDTPVFLGVEKVAKRYDMAVVFLKNRRVKRGHYEVEIVKLTDSAKSLDDHELTNRHVKVLEELIREEPAYWLWTHRRWKYTREIVRSKRKH